MPISEWLPAILQSIRHAVHGMGLALHSQRNFRIHVGVAVLVLLAGFACRFSRQEMALLLLTVSLVLVSEMLNTALEIAMNLVEIRQHPAVRHAKDIAAGAVLLVVLGSILVGALLFGPRLCAGWRP